MAHSLVRSSSVVTMVLALGCKSGTEKPPEPAAMAEQMGKAAQELGTTMARQADELGKQAGRLGERLAKQGEVAGQQAELQSVRPSASRPHRRWPAPSPPGPDPGRSASIG